jgi:hypothetical protein
MEYFDTILKFISYFTYYPESIRAPTWQLAAPLLTALHDYAIDYVGDAMTCLLNYLTKDIATFLSLNGVTYTEYSKPSADSGIETNLPVSENRNVGSGVEVLLKIVTNLFEMCDSEKEYHSKYAAQLLSTLLVCGKHAKANALLEPLFPQILDVTVKRMMSCKRMSLKLKLLDVFLAAVYFNPLLTFSILDRVNTSIVSTIFSTLFQNLDHIDKDSSERILVLAFKTLLFETPTHLLPQAVVANFVPMFTQIVREIELIEEEAEKRGNEEDEESDDEYHLGGGDDDGDFDFDLEGNDFEGDDEDGEEEEDEDEDESPHRLQGQRSIRSQLAVPEGGFTEDEDVINAEDESYRTYLEKLEKKQQSEKQGQEQDGKQRKIYRDGVAMFDESEVEDEEDDDEFDFTLPTDNVDILLDIMQTIQQQQTANPQAIQQLLAALQAEDTQRLASYATVAKQRLVQST